MTNKTVAVVTSTIGRDELVRAIESVKAQTYSCRHYIFVDGEQFLDKVKGLVEPYQDLIITYLPMNTGKNGMVNSSINAIASFLVEEDIICYLDDDNWYKPNHVEELVKVLEKGADFAYSLRDFYSLNGEFICSDDWESLGYWRLNKTVKINLIDTDKTYPVVFNFNNRECHIDTNTYAFPRNLAIELSRSWYSGIHNDRHIYKKLQELGKVGVGSARYTVNYSADLTKMINTQGDEELESLLARPGVRESLIKTLCEVNIEYHGNQKPWSEEY
ncbi:glycosyltransferase [Rodentibacter genomosp. 2]|uniref:glycosyltransferase n=1 Tax=Rodentibacter genomosp. 2 TaxID=1908266 RepID=UPI0009CCD61B|nr:glycosyltransferase [Rodentibacter genomosp. 2]